MRKDYAVADFGDCEFFVLKTRDFVRCFGVASNACGLPFDKFTSCLLAAAPNPLKILLGFLLIQHKVLSAAPLARNKKT